MDGLGSTDGRTMDSADHEFYHETACGEAEGLHTDYRFRIVYALKAELSS